MVPLRTPTLPPATRTNCYIVGDAGRARWRSTRPRRTPTSRRGSTRTSTSSGIRLAAVVLTHHHVDHVGDAARLAAKHGVPVWAHRETAARVAGRVRGDAHARRRRGARRRPQRGCAPCSRRDTRRGTSASSTRRRAPSSPATWWRRWGRSSSSRATAATCGSTSSRCARLRGEVDGGATRLLPAHGPPIVDGGARLDFYVAHRLEREARVAGGARRRAGDARGAGAAGLSRRAGGDLSAGGALAAGAPAEASSTKDARAPSTTTGAGAVSK